MLPDVLAEDRSPWPLGERECPDWGWSRSELAAFDDQPAPARAELLGGGLR